jgi:molybdopterin-guanine dinucleotide biosynthesis protein A
MEPTPPYAAIVLAGGAGKRLGGADKAAIEVAGATLLERTLDATGGAVVTVVVGPAREVRAGVVVVQEQPPGGGPVAAVAAGLRATAAASATDVVIVLACDMPFVDTAALDGLVRELVDRDDADAALYVDGDGRSQYLAAAYRRERLSEAVEAIGEAGGASMRAVVARLTVAEIAAHPDLTLDCDTWQDVERTRRILEDR